MVDELLNISIIGHLVVFVTIIKGGLHVIVFLGLLEIEDKINDFVIIFYYWINYLRIWGNDLCKFVAFGGNGANIMVDFHGGVAT